MAQKLVFFHLLRLFPFVRLLYFTASLEESLSLFDSEGLKDFLSPKLTSWNKIWHFKYNTNFKLEWKGWNICKTAESSHHAVLIQPMAASNLTSWVRVVSIFSFYSWQKAHKCISQNAELLFSNAKMWISSQSLKERIAHENIQIVWLEMKLKYPPQPEAQTSV